MAFHPQPRPAKGTAAKAKAKRRRAVVKLDAAESAKVRDRSSWCEMTERGQYGIYVCGRRAAHVHHLLSGRGVRGRGPSALAANKLHLCEQCHADVHAHKLVPEGTQHYRRVR